VTASDLPLMAARTSVLAFAQRLVRDRLVVGTSGNISCREGDLVAVTPSGTDYDTMLPEDVVVVDLEGTVVHGDLAPTVELPLHLACYRRHGAQAVVHTHSTAATALSLLRDEVPPVHYQIAMFGGSVAVAPYATYGTDQLMENVSAALQGRTGAVMKHHGTITLGDTLGKAYDPRPPTGVALRRVAAGQCRRTSRHAARGRDRAGRRGLRQLRAAASLTRAARHRDAPVPGADNAPSF